MALCDHLAMLAELKRKIENTRRCMDSPICLPAPVRWAAWLTGTGACIDACIRRILQLRLERLHRERQTLVALLQWQDMARQRHANH